MRKLLATTAAATACLAGGLVTGSVAPAHATQAYVCQGAAGNPRAYSASEECTPDVSGPVFSVEIRTVDGTSGRMCVRAKYKLDATTWSTYQDCTSNSAAFATVRVGGGGTAYPIRNVKVFNDDDHQIRATTRYYS